MNSNEESFEGSWESGSDEEGFTAAQYHKKVSAAAAAAAGVKAKEAAADMETEGKAGEHYCMKNVETTPPRSPFNHDALCLAMRDALAFLEHNALLRAALTCRALERWAASHTRAVAIDHHLDDFAVSRLGARFTRIRSFTIGRGNDVNGAAMLGDVGVAALAAHCPRLTAIDLNTCVNLTNAAVVALAVHCPALESIDLSLCEKLSSAAIDGLATHSTELMTLVLQECPCISESSLALLAASTRLTTLDVAACEEIDNDAIAALVLACGATLVEVNIQGCWQVTDTGGVLLPQRCPHLARLTFGSAPELESLLSDTFIDALVAGVTTTGNCDTIYGAASPPLRRRPRRSERGSQLTHLSLFGCLHIFELGSRNHRHWPMLTSLSLESGVVDSRSLCDVLKSCGETLTDLDISWSDIDGVSFANSVAEAKLARLRSLRLSGDIVNELPAHFFNGKFKNTLISLHLYSHTLQLLPSSIVELHRLKTLFLFCEKLKKVTRAELLWMNRLASTEGAEVRRPRWLDDIVIVCPKDGDGSSIPEVKQESLEEEELFSAVSDRCYFILMGGVAVIAVASIAIMGSFLEKTRP